VPLTEQENRLVIADSPMAQACWAESTPGTTGPGGVRADTDLFGTLTLLRDRMTTTRPW
jgi:hypothetical protein